MEQIRQQPTTRSWRLLGLTGMVLSVALLLNEGQARTLPIPSPVQSIKVQSNHHTEMASTVRPLENNRGSQSTKLAQHPEVGTQEMNNQEKPHKKKLGLAILFLGMLAEKS
ncbi:MAG: hypothetical protein OEM58_02175 [Nitrospirota bacterium]|nr:hypothetical protein [Nitrospirota bacterium]